MTKRRVFISYQHLDQMKAKGFNLMSYNKNVDVEFVGRHLLDPVKSENPAYIRAQIGEKMQGCSAMVVLLGSETADSKWVTDEIQMGVDRGMGIVGVRLEPGADAPESLTTCGAEVLEWADVVEEFNDAVERAILATGRRMPLNSSSTCARVG